MPKLKITTAQNVTIEYELATVMERLAGGAFDVFVQTIYMLITFSAISRGMYRADWTWLLYFLPVMLYSLFFETFFNGRTPGKMVLGSKVIRIDGQRAGFASYFIRWVFRLPDIYLTSGGVAISSIFFSNKAQRVGDLSAGTTVVRVKPRPVYNPLFQYVPPGYVIRYPEVKLLSEQDILTLGELLAHYRKLGTSFKLNALMQTTRKKMELMLGIQPVEKTDVLLQTILVDYTAIYKERMEEGNKIDDGF